jgi:peptidoglycan-N-acetylglucosamine deacetylase
MTKIYLIKVLAAIAAFVAVLALVSSLVISRGLINSTETPTRLPTKTEQPFNEKETPTPLKKAASPILLSTITLAPTPNIIVPKEIVIGNTSKKQVIFTFDAGSGSQSLGKILDLLEKYNLKASFFLTGKWIEQNSQNTKLIADKGHEIFNHTYSHPDLTKTIDTQIREELKKTDELVMKHAGKSTKPYFRPPYGARNQTVLKVAAEEGYTSVYWSTDAWDWRENEGITADQVKARVIDNLKPGAIYLFHVGSNTTGEVLEDIIDHLKLQGYDIVALTRGL